MQDIFFDIEISRDSMEDLLKELRCGDGKQRVWIASPGGTFEFFSVLAPRILRKGFISVGVDVCSAANILYLLGHKRYALPDSTFFFHEVRAMPDEDRAITLVDLDRALDMMNVFERTLEHEALEECRRNMRNAQAWMLDFISKQTRIPRARFLDLMRAEATLGAQEAVRYGIVDRIMSEDRLRAGILE